MSVSRQLATKVINPRTGKPHRSSITDRDIIGFGLLGRYGNARFNTLHAFMGGSLTNLMEHWKYLFKEPNAYVYRPRQQWENLDAYHRSTVYGLTKKGYAALWERGIALPYKPAPHNLQHELMWAEILQSIELGAAFTDGVRPLRWHYEILNSNSLPATTKAATSPFAIRYDTRETKDGTAHLTIESDGFPIGIEDTRSAKPKYTFLIIEADCDSEGIETDIVSKMRAYIKCIQDDIFYDHYGFDPYILFATTNIVHMRNMMAGLASLTKEPEILARFLFTIFPTTKTYDRPIKPDGCMLFRDYERASLPPFNFLKDEILE